MAYRCIMVENKAHLSIRQQQLVIALETEHLIPLEDISAILVENRQSTITAAAMANIDRKSVV